MIFFLMKKNPATPHTHPLNISNVPIFQFKTNNNNNKLFTAYENSEKYYKIIFVLYRDPIYHNNNKTTKQNYIFL